MLNGSDAGRALGSIKTERKAKASAVNLARAKAQMTEEQKAVHRAAISAAQRARWDRYRAEKAEKALAAAMKEAEA